MDHSPQKPAPIKAKGAAATVREDRLKAALKANMARRKAQAKARSAGDMTGNDEEQQQGE